MASGQSFTLSIKALFDASDIKAKVGDIQKSFSNLRLPDNLKRSLDTSFTSLNKALNDFEQRAAKGVTSKTDAKGITSSLEKVINEFSQVDKVISKVKQELGSGADLSKLIKLDDATLERLRNLKKEIDDIQQQLANINASKIDNIKKSLEQIKTTGARKQGEAALKLFEEGDVQNAITTLDKIIKKLEDYKRAQADTGKDLSNVEASLRALGQMRTDMDQAQSQSSTLVTQQNEKAAESAQILSQAQQNVVNQVNQSAQAMSNYGQQASNASTGVNNLATNQANLNKELDQVKSRIQYFLGLSNTINLVKRAIRSAVSTVKELDKAMTETAVVTQNTVSDMWAKLPEYTKRANQLGVSTLAAYQSATLYYQQGLNDEQAANLSVETLKMARIAGLEAAEATDRMTNALRGFNMELNAMNAQRVDDVYSQLAAMSASNVDEISTAMTKVASLAHSAGMEFETTSAFLAQIIETTRESAETAGTALKTVVARFSEVKKLVDTNQLKGQDEEGELIDVNKVSAALRTAGIDLNKYFLGEVGLDDIFMELASKWDTLTSVQQRYIATQAAGSRQQSRFIALMQDYARTQELVSAAYDSEGASQRQFEKTQDSLESKLARLKNAWNEFLMGITNSSAIKAAVDALRTLLDIINKITGAFGQGASGVLKFVTAAAGIAGLRAAFRSGGIAEKLLGSFGNSFLGRIFGFGGNTNSQVVAAGAQFHTEVVAAGADFAAAVNGAATGQVITGGTGTGSLIRTPWQAIQDFKANSPSNWKLDPNYIAARQAFQASPTNENLRAVGLARQQAIHSVTTPKTLFGALGNRFVGTKIGGKIASGLGAGLAKFGIGSGAAVSGAAALATTLGAVAVAATLAGVAIKKIYDASPAGQIKIAEKYAAAMSEVAKNTQEAAQEIKQVATKTKEYEKAVNEATNLSDRRQAIQDQNEYILSLLDKDATYAQYIQSAFTEDNQLYLTLDSDALAAAVDKIAEGATKASAYSNFANAMVQQQRVDWYDDTKLYGIDVGNRREIVGYNDDNEPIYASLSDKAFQDYSRQQVARDNAELQKKGYLSTGVAELIDLEDTNLAPELANLIADALGETIDLDKIQQKAEKQQKANWWASAATDQALRSEYTRLYGSELGKDYDRSEIAKAIALAETLEETVQAKIPNLIDVVRNANGQLLLEVITGSYDGVLEEGQLKKAFENLSDPLKQTFYSLLSTDADNIYSVLESYNNKLVEAQKNFRKTAAGKLYKAGITDLNLLDKVANELSIQQEKKLVEFTDQWADYNSEFQQALLNPIAKAMLSGDWENSDLQALAEKITDNPILTNKNLLEAKESKNDDIANLAIKLRKNGRENNGFLSDLSQVQYFLTSGEFDNLTEQIEGFVKASGQINANNVQELAQESKLLATLLDNDAISARGLASALTALESGNTTVLDLNESVLKLFDSFDTAGNAISRAGSFIQNFNPGEDLGDAFDFINSSIETMQELLDNRELGGQLRGYLGAFFTVPPESIDSIQYAIDLLRVAQENGGAGFWTDLVGFTMNEEGIIEDMGVQDFLDSDQFLNYRDYIRNIVESSDYFKNSGLEGFTDNFYDLIIRTLANHDIGQSVMKELGAAELQKLIGAYGEGAFTQESVQAIADAYGLKPQDLVDAYTNAYNLDHIDFSELESKLRETTTTISDLYSQYTDEFAKQGLDRTPVNLFKMLGADENGVFNLDTFKVKIGQVVPEVANGTISVEDWFNEQVQANGGSLKVPVEYQVTKKIGVDDNGANIYAPQTVRAEVEVTNLQEYETAVNQLQTLANQELLGQSLTGSLDDAEETAQNLSNIISGLGENTKLSSITAEITTSQEAANTLNETLGKSINKNINIVPLQQNLVISGAGGYVQLYISAFAKGGKIGSLAVGRGKPGLALTGEEDPEIVWNKEEGYAYLAGKDGPEINNLRPGDQVFNAKETKDILKRSGIKSFAKGTIQSLGGSSAWNPDKPRSGGGGGSGKDEKEKKESTWRNELDWLYDLMEDIAEEERKQTEIQSKYELAVKDLTKTGKDLFNLTKQELASLTTQLDAQNTAFIKRTQQMGELQTLVNSKGFQDYLQWNQKDQTLEIDWDKIEAIQDKDTYEELTDLISRMESVQDQMDDAQKSILDIKKQIEDLQNRYLQQYLDFQKRVLDAVVKQYQEAIDNLSELNSTLTDTNQSILDSIQKEIDLERQIRDNTDREQDIADMEARLAYLQRDTSGANDAEIRQLQKQLEDARESYADTLVDQALQRLSDSNDEAAEQREKQIELMQAQLDYWQESGGLWNEVADLIATGFSGEGSIIEGSALWEILKSADSWESLSEAQKKNWANELILSTNEVGAHLIQLSGGLEVNADMVRDSIAETNGILTSTISVELERVRAILEKMGTLGGTPEHSYTSEKTEGEGGYATGGLNTRPGKAMLHGTANEPEYVLNARQTDAFLRLAEVLPTVMSGNVNTSSINYGNSMFDININVASIASDYDVDKLVTRLKDDLADAASYRNVNALNFIR